MLGLLLFGLPVIAFFHQYQKDKIAYCNICTKSIISSSCSSASASFFCEYPTALPESTRFWVEKKNGNCMYNFLTTLNGYEDIIHPLYYVIENFIENNCYQTTKTRNIPKPHDYHLRFLTHFLLYTQCNAIPNNIINMIVYSTNKCAFQRIYEPSIFLKCYKDGNITFMFQLSVHDLDLEDVLDEITIKQLSGTFEICIQTAFNAYFPRVRLDNFTYSNVQIMS